MTEIVEMEKYADYTCEIPNTCHYGTSLWLKGTHAFEKAINYANNSSVIKIEGFGEVNIAHLRSANYSNI